MKSLRKHVCCVIVLLLALSICLIFQPASAAQTVPKPATPEFSLRYVKASCNLTTFYPSDGSTITQQVDNSTVEIIIKNQLYTYANGNITYLLFYDIQTKSHFEDSWVDHYPLSYKLNDLWGGGYSWYISAGNPSFQEYNSDYTVLSLPSKLYPINTDFSVKALVGYSSFYYNTPKNYHPLDLRLIGRPSIPAVAFDTSSEWSNAQTVSLTQPSSTPTPNPTTTQIVNSTFNSKPLIYCIIALVVALIASISFFKLQKAFEDT